MAPSHRTGDCLIRARKSADIDLSIQDECGFAHPQWCIRSGAARQIAGPNHFRPIRPAMGGAKTGFESVIMHDFASKSSFFMLLGASRLKRRILVILVAV